MADTDGQILELTTRLDTLETRFNSHTHRYAGSPNAGGAANSVSTENNVLDELVVAGVSLKRPSKIVYNSFVKIEDNKLAADFKGNLEGNATSADRLNEPFKLKLEGKVTGEADIDGSGEVSIDTKFAPNDVVSGIYGPYSNNFLNIGDSFTVPKISVDSAGIITNIENKSITLPSNISLSGTIDNRQVRNTDIKYYLVATDKQDSSGNTGSESGIYFKDGKLFSENSPVINETSAQNLQNKTYEGYTLGPASEKDIETEVNGVINSDKLITSDIFARHEHSYAGSEIPGGPALDVTFHEFEEGCLVSGNNNKISVNSNIGVKEDSLSMPKLVVNDYIQIGNAKLWIDESAKVIDLGAYSSTGSKISAKNVVTMIPETSNTYYDADKIITKINNNVDLLNDAREIAEENIHDLKEDLTKLQGTVSGLSDITSNNTSKLFTVENNIGNLLSDNNRHDSSIRSLQTAITVVTKDLVESKEAVNEYRDDINELSRRTVTDTKIFSLRSNETYTYNITDTYGTSAMMFEHIFQVSCIDSEPGSPTGGMYIGADNIVKTAFDSKKLKITNTDNREHQFLLVVK